MLTTKVERLAMGFKKRYGDLLEYDLQKELKDLKVIYLTFTWGEQTDVG